MRTPMTVDRWLQQNSGFWCRICNRPVIPYWKIIHDPYGDPVGLLPYHQLGESRHAVTHAAGAQAPPGPPAAVN